MSAGGLSYSGLTNFGKVTLPSVETWGTNTNILKDPPSSIHTRRINKVGETSNITTMLDQSGDRACEYIKVYARGTNPSVSVSYSNNGSNGGGLSGSLPGLNNVGQAYSPYPIMKGGAFRPPLQTQEMLMPLSRQPRVWTTAMTTPAFVDYSKRLLEFKEKCKLNEIKENVIEGEIRPTVTFNNYMSDKHNKHTDNYIISDKQNISTNSGIALPNSVVNNSEKIVTGTYENLLHADVNVNHQNTKKYVNNNKKFTESYINKDVLEGEMTTNTSQKEVANFDNNKINTERFMQNPLHSETTSVISMPGETTSQIIMDTDRFLQEPNNIEVEVNQIGTGEFNANNTVDSKRYLQDNLNAFAMSNTTKNISMNENLTNKHTSSYLQSVNLIEASTNSSSNINTTSIDNIADLNSIKIKEAPIISKDGTIIDKSGQNYIHSDITLERNLPKYQIELNRIQKQLQKNINPEKLKELHKKLGDRNGNINNSGITKNNILTRQVYIPEKINAGKFEAKPTSILLDKTSSENNVRLNMEKQDIMKRAKMFNDRFQGGLPKF